MARRANWDKEVVRKDVEERVESIAAYLSMDLSALVQSNVLGKLALIYTSSGNIRQGNEIDEYIVKELNFLKLLKKLPPDVAAKVPIAAPVQPLSARVPFAAPRPAMPPPRPLLPPPLPRPLLPPPLAPPRLYSAEKRKAPECQDGVCRIPKKFDAVPKFLAAKSNQDWFCPLDGSCYIEDFDNAGNVDPEVIASDSDVEFVDVPDRSRSKSSQATILPDAFVPDRSYRREDAIARGLVENVSDDDTIAEDI